MAVNACVHFLNLPLDCGTKGGAVVCLLAVLPRGRNNTPPLDRLVVYQLGHPSDGTTTGGTWQGLAPGCQVMLNISVHGQKYSRDSGNTHIYA